MTDTEARIADKVRKALTIVLSAAATWLLLRVLFRLAQGRQTLLDPELVGFLLVGVVAVVWVLSIKRVSRAARGERPDRPTDGSDRPDPGTTG